MRNPVTQRPLYTILRSSVLRVGSLPCGVQPVGDALGRTICWGHDPLRESSSSIVFHHPRRVVHVENAKDEGLPSKSLQAARSLGNQTAVRSSLAIVCWWDPEAAFRILQGVISVRGLSDVD